MGGSPEEGEKHSQKEGQQVSSAPERGSGRGVGGKRPLLDAQPNWAASLFIHFRNFHIFSSALKILRSGEFFYRVGVGLLNRVVTISHFSKEILPQTTSLQEGAICKGLCPISWYSHQPESRFEGPCWLKPL